MDKVYILLMLLTRLNKDIIWQRLWGNYFYDKYQLDL